MQHLVVTSKTASEPEGRNYTKRFSFEIPSAVQLSDSSRAGQWRDSSLENELELDEDVIFGFQRAEPYHPDEVLHFRPRPRLIVACTTLISAVITQANPFPANSWAPSPRHPPLLRRSIHGPAKVPSICVPCPSSRGDSCEFHSCSVSGFSSLYC